MLQFLLYAGSFLLVVNAGPARDVWKFPCHEYLDIVSDWPDGYRGILQLPVVQAMSPLPDSMKDGHVIIKFNRSISTLDVPEGDHARRNVTQNGKEYKIFIKFPNTMKKLKIEDVFSLDISVHHKRWMKGKVGIVGLQFGNFKCPEPEPVRDPYPLCDEYIHMIDNTQPDAFRAEMKIPVKYSMTGWNLEIRFTNEILVLDVADGIRSPAARNIKAFTIENREYNGFVKKDSTFRLEFMVHWDRNRFKKSDVKISFIRFGLFQCRLLPTLPSDNMYW